MSTERIPVGLVGVTGYTGMELARILARHPSFDLVAATSRAEAGRKLADVYPFLLGMDIGAVEISQPDPDQIAAKCSLVFLAVPHGAAMDMAADLLARDVKVVDLSADFRLRDTDSYAQWYGLEHRHAALVREAVYGLPELYADAIARTRLVANPGCYPTSVILGLLPLLRNGLVETDTIVADSKSGATGAGRKAAVGTLFCEVADSFRAYNLGRHRHTPEIEQELSRLAGIPLAVSFNPHLLPINRGILSTLYARFIDETPTVEALYDIYAETYAKHEFVRVLPPGRLPETRWVRGTMYCDIGLVCDPRTNRAVVVSAIDNLCRGASGQAVACANLMSGLPLAEGLSMPPLMP
ncbi:N-acetyl-gamma-glutamyl-phosphate reductase [Oceanidesulfovibrio indonesiensis]|uniref:N-acetyl-gamma-glutamyl-phosphate reductase n=1 Tax=Oceanidesulfovibrio indonesiensis TaxID=54767 RepID=A0A7M3MBG8_9BACT|nr:N-acetyl-gamma-glutamyl-phosphate reductase [Oceanidesulfovibrio indonesiensis]TVM15533.1 N-acetyl-gamma-glutamyl-phosphate reductase [Oceanidesulfovibrio indonesiensis]